VITYTCHIRRPHTIHYPHPIIGPTDAGDRDRPVVAPRARTRTPDARLHKTYMKPNAECTHGQYSFLFDQQTYKTAHGRYRIDSCTARLR
jgi:hypothetical protein